jgi:hypothetical protein
MGMRRFHITLAGLAMLLGLSAASVRAAVSPPQVLLDTNNGNYAITNSTSAYYIHNFSIDDLREAIPLSVTGSIYRLDTIKLHVAARFSAAQQLKVSLMSDAGNLPGATLGSYILTNLPVRPDDGDSATINQPTQLDTLDHPLLFPGTQYWIALSIPTQSNNTDVYWFLSPNNPIGRLATLSSPLNGTQWTVSNTAPLPGITALGTAIPEAAAPTLVLLIALRACRRHRRG